jgi:hypothetical protein
LIASNADSTILLSCERRQALRRSSLETAKVGKPMFIVLAIVLLLIWLGVFFVAHVTFWLIHLLLVFAVIAFILHFVMGGRRSI